MEALRSIEKQVEKARDYTRLMGEATLHRTLYGPGTDQEASLTRQAEATGGANEAEAQELDKKADFYRDQYGPGSNEEYSLRKRAEKLRSQL